MLYYELTLEKIHEDKTSTVEAVTTSSDKAIIEDLAESILFMADFDLMSFTIPDGDFMFKMCCKDTCLIIKTKEEP